MKILVSACLIGTNCKYDGKNNLIDNSIIKKLLDDGFFVPVCPEVLGGLPTPRIPSEVSGNKVVNQLGIDVTKEFEKGAKKAFDILKDNNIKVALLKAKSPSCGKGLIYDGSFNKNLIEGNGIFTQMLLDNNIKIFTEKELDKFIDFVSKF